MTKLILEEACSAAEANKDNIYIWDRGRGSRGEVMTHDTDTDGLSDGGAHAHAHAHRAHPLELRLTARPD